MKDNEIRFKYKYFIPIYGLVNFGEDNKYKELENAIKQLKFLTLTGTMYLYHGGLIMATIYNKEIFQNLEQLLN